MTTSLREEKVFKDPIHKYIYVQDQIIWDLINTREFQRLRRIRQLGTSYLTFHGAEHSRFSHSLGVYEIARKIISLFERNQYEDWPVEEKLLCLCAALLHDVGHGPFSHSIEPVFELEHEEWTCSFLLGDSEIRRVLRRVSDDFPERVAGVIRKTHANTISVSLISSQLDADRMDYLLRDAYFTGVNYGTFDMERILRVLRPHRGSLVVKESGMHAVEDYLMSRYQMYWQIYFHPVTRSSEIVLKKIFQRARALYEDGFPFRFLLPPLRALLAGTPQLEEYFQLDESLIQTALQMWSDEDDRILADLCSRFLHRRLFKYTAMDEPDRGMLEAVRERMTEAGIDPVYYMDMDETGDLPYDVYRSGKPGVSLPIQLLGEDGSLSEISRKSEIVRALSGIRGGRTYLYYPADWIELPRS